MFHRKALLGGLVGGVSGAGIWALVVMATGYEIGWIAWAVGGMVGYGVAWGNRGFPHTPLAAGVLAVAITLLAIVGGKYLAIQASFPSDQELVELLLADPPSDEYVITYLADEVVEEHQVAGRLVDWPAGVDPSVASTRVEYPPALWAEAESRWTAMSEAEREVFRLDVEATVRENITAQLPLIRSEIKEGAFLGSFGAMDLLFFGLAVVTAFGMASGGKKNEEEVAAEFREAVRLAAVEVMLADGTAGDEEIGVVREVYAGIAGLELSEEILQADIERAQSGQLDISIVLGELSPYLTDQGKALVMQAALAVAGADGEIQPEEELILGNIAAAVGLTGAQLSEMFTEPVQESSA